MDKLDSSVSLRHGAELHHSKRNSKEEVWLRELQFLPQFLLVPAREVSYFGIWAARLRLASPLALTSPSLQDREKRDKGLCQDEVPPTWERPGTTQAPLSGVSLGAVTSQPPTFNTKGQPPTFLCLETGREFAGNHFLTKTEALIRAFLVKCSKSVFPRQ